MVAPRHFPMTMRKLGRCLHFVARNRGQNHHTRLVDSVRVAEGQIHNYLGRMKKKYILGAIVSIATTSRILKGTLEKTTDNREFAIPTHQLEYISE